MPRMALWEEFGGRDNRAEINVCTIEHTEAEGPRSTRKSTFLEEISRLPAGVRGDMARRLSPDNPL